MYAMYLPSTSWLLSPGSTPSICMGTSYMLDHVDHHEVIAGV